MSKTLDPKDASTRIIDRIYSSISWVLGLITGTKSDQVVLTKSAPVFRVLRAATPREETLEQLLTKNAELAKRVELLESEILTLKGTFTLEHIFDRLRPDSLEQLALALAVLKKSGQVRTFFRVEDPNTHAGLGDYDQFEDIPDELPDRYEENTVRVTPEIVKPFYVIQ